MWVHYGYGAGSMRGWLSNNRISGFSQGCLNFQNYQGQAGFFQTLHKLKEGSKLIGNNGKTFICNTSPGLKKNTFSEKSQGKPWAKIQAGNGTGVYNFHFMLLSQLKSPTTPPPTPNPSPPPTPNPGPPPLPPNKI